MSIFWTTWLGKVILTFFISMLPFVELRGAIPVAAIHGLDFAVAFPVAILGNLIPVPFIILFIRKIFSWMRRVFPRLNRLVDRLEEKGKSKKEQIERGAFWGLFVLVAIPLPGTGAWTGTMIASVLGLEPKRSFLAALGGVLLATVIMSLISGGVFALV